MTSRIISKEDCCPEGFRWITLKRITWEDPSGRQRLWESAERTTRRGEVDGVAIVARVVSKGQPPLLPVLKQYRPPLAAYCLELPAGLVDAGESAGEAAVRELREETGYTGRVVEVTPVCASDPGMSNANMRYATLEVDGDAPENQNVSQQLEDGEFIQVELVPWTGLLQHLKAEMAATGCEVDARLLSFAYGLELARQALVAGATEAAGQQLIERHQQAGPTADGLVPDSSASWVPLPFGSPILTPQASASQQPLSVALDPVSGKQDAGKPARRPAPAWLQFAAGGAVGALGCWLLQQSKRK